MANLRLREETEMKYRALPEGEKRFVEGYMSAVLQLLGQKKKRRPKRNGKETKST